MFGLEKKLVLSYAVHTSWGSGGGGPALFENVPLVECTYPVVTCMPGELP